MDTELPVVREEPRQLLADFVHRVPGAAHAALASTDGIVLATSPYLPPTRAEQFSAVASGLLSLSVTVADLTSTRLRQTLVHMQEGLLVVTPVGYWATVAVLADDGADMTVIGYEVARLVERLGDESVDGMALVT